jgi:hypothetical protein
MIVEDPDGSTPAGAYVSVPLLGALLRAIRRRGRRREHADGDEDDPSG